MGSLETFSQQKIPNAVRLVIIVEMKFLLMLKTLKAFISAGLIKEHFDFYVIQRVFVTSAIIQSK